MIAEDGKLYNAKEVGMLLGISAFTIRKWIKDGTIQAIKIGGGWRVTGKTINDLVNQNNGGF